MKKLFIFLSGAVLVALLFVLALRTIPIHVYDGFEADHLS